MANMLKDAAVSGAVGTPIDGGYVDRMSIQGYVTGTGAVSATVIVEGSNNGIDWVVISTLNMSGTGRGIDGGVVQTYFRSIRARLTAISGTDAKAFVDAIWR